MSVAFGGEITCSLAALSYDIIMKKVASAKLSVTVPPRGTSLGSRGRRGERVLLNILNS